MTGDIFRSGTVTHILLLWICITVSFVRCTAMDGDVLQSLTISVAVAAAGAAAAGAAMLGALLLDGSGDRGEAPSPVRRRRKGGRGVGRRHRKKAWRYRKWETGDKSRRIRIEGDLAVWETRFLNPRMPNVPGDGHYEEFRRLFRLPLPVFYEIVEATRASGKFPDETISGVRGAKPAPLALKVNPQVVHRLGKYVHLS